MRFLSLFAGIGGFDLGLERAGFECAGQVEINPFCQKILAKHWPNVKRISDIREVKGNEFGTVDLVCGGFPCQPFSSAGRRRGKEDTRYLWPEMLRVVDAVQPSYVIGENVVGLINVALDEICDNLEEKGFVVQPLVIPACAVGAPHQRERVWIMAWNPTRTGASSLSRVCEGSNSNSNRGSSFEGFWNRNPEPEMGGVVHGLPRRLDRITALGNAVVPQVVEELGKAIKAGALHYSLQQPHGGQSVSQPAPNCLSATSPC